MKHALIVAAILAATAATATPAQARPCVTAGRTIVAREHITCARAKTVARRYFATFKTPRGWDCAHGRRGMWRGYCQTRRRYFQWRPV